MSYLLILYKTNDYGCRVRYKTIVYNSLIKAKIEGEKYLKESPSLPSYNISGYDKYEDPIFTVDGFYKAWSYRIHKRKPKQ